MGLHSIEEKDVKKYKCAVCGDTAVWYDDKFSIHTKGGHDIQVGKNKGLVYATCDHCGKVVCGSPDRRGKYKSRIIRLKNMLAGAYKGSKCCMQEAHYVNHMGEVTTITCCKDFECVRHFQDDLRQKRLKEAQTS